jgi:dihydrofolate synthase / folylpolyglutamate synthase
MDDSYELWAWLDAAQLRGVQPGLARMERLLGALGNPEQNLRCLHVAGTNGKGSVCAFAESILRASGHRTGFYSSPHLINFSERIRINGVPVSEGEILEGIAQLKAACAGWRKEELPTYFELVTALAFLIFSDAACEIILLETGLGGRLDATNAAPKLACAITPIALDHTEWLGETLAEIAREKSGIFRPNLPAVISPQPETAMREIELIAQKLQVVLIPVQEPLDSSWTLGLVGAHQRFNAAVALELVKAGGFVPSREEVACGLAKVSWPGRFQRLKHGRLILDGAHNLHAARQLVQTWREEFAEQKCLLIFGALADKAPQAMLSTLASIAEEIFLVPVASPRSLAPQEYAGGLPVPVHLFHSLREGLETALARSQTEESLQGMEVGLGSKAPVLLAGSLFLVGEALSLESDGTFLPRSQ